MSRVRLVRLAAAATGLLTLAALGVSTTPPARSGSGADDLRAVASSSPTNAAKVFRWGNAQWHDGFIGPLSSAWASNNRSHVRNQNGMLTLEGTRTSGTVTARLTGHVRQYGRWEARVRGRNLATGGTPYRVLWELVPASGGYHCGARSIILSHYSLGTNRAAMHLRTLPNRDHVTTKSLSLSRDEFHTYAIEVTKSRISWFVDTKVIRTEKRSTARSGAKYQVRFRLADTPGKKMRPGRMQMDWVRYYTLDRPNAKSVTAPATTLRRYGGAC